MGKFVITKDSKGEFRFKLNAGNGETILVSKGYTTKANCENGIASVRTNFQHDERFEKTTSSNGKHYFNLNDVVATIRALGVASAGTKKGQDSKTGILSEEMNQTGRFSNHFVVDLG